MPTLVPVTSAPQPASGSRLAERRNSTASPPRKSTATAPTTLHGNHQHKIKHRSSTPIIAWVQRKFAAAGTVKQSPKPTSPPPVPAHPHNARTVRTYPPNRTSNPGSRPSKPQSRAHSIERGTSKSKRQSMRKKIVQNNHQVPAALVLANSSNLPVSPNVQAYNSDSPPPSPRSGSLSFSLAPGSTWSPSNPPEADDDASIRPLPPTSPPSPAPSRANTFSSNHTSGYVSDPRTFRSGAASTKPTTLLSIDFLPGAGMAHIAQVAPSITSGRSPSLDGAAPSSPSFPRSPNNTRHSGGAPSQSQSLTTPTSVMFSIPGPRHPLAATQHAEDLASDVEGEDHVASTQAPGHSHPHPRNNPRPSSPPPDNASTLTLASSNFAVPRPATGGASSVISRFPGSLSHYGGGSIHRVLNGNESIITAFGMDGIGGQDADASVRALRPRSRRGSWASVGSTETNQTGWSAAVHHLGPAARKKRGEGDEDEMNLYEEEPEEDEDAGNDADAEGTEAPKVVEEAKRRPVSELLLESQVIATSPTPEDSDHVTPKDEAADPVSEAAKVVNLADEVPVPSLLASEMKAVVHDAVKIHPVDEVEISLPRRASVSVGEGRRSDEVVGTIKAADRRRV